MSTRPTILIVDDERRICRSIEILLQEQGPFNTRIATDYYGAIEQLKGPVDLVLTDLTMPGKDGIELLRAIRQEKENLPVILMTAYSTIQTAVTSMKEGAHDYILKPFENEKLLSLIRKCLKLPRETVQDQESVKSRFGDILGQSPVMQEVYFRIGRAAETDSTVLITGESGTGKELVARAIHFSGPRKTKAFIPFNCTAVPETLLESELFGHERGAFSGAHKQREGKFEIADRGTLFLDEIGEMTMPMQVKLLRVLQERSFERVGGVTTLHVDVRIIAATHRNLALAVQNGQFREDLFYRLNVVTLDLPPLRDRPEDIPMLLDFFLQEKSKKLGLDKRTLSPRALDLLLRYSYPGNVRELENIIERGVVISRTPEIDSESLPIGNVSSVAPWGSLHLPLEEGLKRVEVISEKLERELIERALKTHPDKSNTEVAALLGTSRRVLESRMKVFGLGKREK